MTVHAVAKSRVVRQGKEKLWGKAVTVPAVSATRPSDAGERMMYHRTRFLGRRICLLIFQVLAAAIFGGVAVLPAAADIPAEIAARFGNYHAIVIGINNYDAKDWPDLLYAEQDARDLKKILSDSYGFQVTAIFGSDATRKKILKTIRGKVTSLGEDDNLLIFYAGHGQTNPYTDEGFWIPVDATDGVDEESWINFSAVRKLVNAKNADVRRVALITDSCYGGALTERSGPKGGRLSPDDGTEMYQDWLIKSAEKRSRLIIASGGIEGVPDQSEFADALKATLEENRLDMIDLYHVFTKILHNSYFQDQEQTPIIETVLASRPGLAAQFVLIRQQ